MHSPSRFILMAVLYAAGCTAVKPVQPHAFYVPDGSYATEYTPGLRITKYAYPFQKADGAVIFIHGGGWQIGGSELAQYHNWEAALFAHRLRAYSVEHRTAPKYRGADQIHDILKSIEFVKGLAQLHNFPPERISLIGFSSGGHLAVMAALTASAHPDKYTVPRSVVAFYPPLDLKFSLTNGNASLRSYTESYLPENPVWELISPVDALHPGTPPILIIHGESDSLVPAEQSIRFAEKAAVLGIKNVRLILVPKADHSFDQSRGRWARELELAALRFVSR